MTDDSKTKTALLFEKENVKRGLDLELKSLTFLSTLQVQLPSINFQTLKDHPKLLKRGCSPESSGRKWQ